MSVRIVHTLPKDHWRAFVARHPQGNIFHTPELFEIYDRAKGHEPELWAAVNDNQILALFIPVHISLRNGYFRHLTTRSVVFGSVLSIPGAEGDESLKLLLQAYKKTSGRRSLYTELRNITPLCDTLPIVEAEGFAYEDHLNYLINLDLPTELIFEHIGKRTRKNIKNGLNKGRVIIEEVHDKDDLPSCYKLLEMTYRAAHVPLADYSLFEAAFDLLVPGRMARFSVAKVDGAAAATSIELLYKNILYGWYGGMDRAYASYVPNELLMWNILKWGAENGFKKYDFGGAGKPNEEYGVRDFKAKFGGELVCFGRNIWISSPTLMSVSKFAYSALRKILFGTVIRKKNRYRHNELVKAG